MNKAILSEELKIEKLIPGGQALATTKSGKKIFLWNALPGEIVTKAEISKEKSSFLEGAALEIKKPSEHRIKEQDDCYLSTSPWQNMDYAYELLQKKELLVEIFRQQKIELPTVPDFVTDGKDFYYRNKMEYALYFDKDDGKIYPAFRGRGTHIKIPVKKSSLERPEIWQEAEKIIKKLNDEKAEARNFQSLLLRCNDHGEVCGGLYENHKPHQKFENLSDEILGIEYSYSPNGFFQINLPVYELALKEIAKYIHTNKVLDLYSGVGTIGLSVARDKDLTLVEVDKSAYQELVANCSSVNSARPVLAKSEEALEYISPEITVILDPPRAGCDSKLLEKLLEEAPKCIIYLSCNPATQARDVKILEQKYRISSVQPFNFFPRTPHLENLIILEKN